MVRWSSLIIPIMVIISIIVGLVALGFGTNYAINLVQTSRLEAKIQIQQNLLEHYRSEMDYRNTRIEEYLALLSKTQEDLLKSQHILNMANVDLENQRHSKNAIQMKLEDKKLKLTQEQNFVKLLQKEVSATSSSIMNFAILQEMLGPLSRDRLLLIGLRKDLPDSRSAAGQFLNELKELAVSSSPSLGPKADRIIRLLPTYFDWYEKEYESLGLAMEAYINTGAVDFDTAYRDFEKDALLVVVQRIDAVINQLD